MSRRFSAVLLSLLATACFAWATERNNVPIALNGLWLGLTAVALWVADIVLDERAAFWRGFREGRGSVPGRDA